MRICFNDEIILIRTIDNIARIIIMGVAIKKGESKKRQQAIPRLKLREEKDKQDDRRKQKDANS